MKIDQAVFPSMRSGAPGDSPKNGALSEISHLRISTLLEEIQARAPGISLSAAAITAAWLDEAARIRATRLSATIVGLSLDGGDMGDFALSLKIGYNDPVIWAIAEARPGSGPTTGSPSAKTRNGQVVKMIETFFSKRDFGAPSGAGAIALTSYFSGKAMTRGGWRLFLHDNIGQTFDIHIRPLTRLDKLLRGGADMFRRLFSGIPESTIEGPKIDEPKIEGAKTDGASPERHDISKTRWRISGAYRQ